MENDLQSMNADRLGLAQAHPLGSLADGWQQAGDERIFKIIFSPEDATVDFQRIAKDMIARIEQHTGASVEWVRCRPPQHRPSSRPHPRARKIAIGRTAQTSSRTNSQGAARGRPKLAHPAARAANDRGDRAAEKGGTHREPRHALGSKVRRPMAPYAKDPVYMDFGTAATAAELARLLHLKQLGLSKQDIGDRWLIRSDFLGQLREMKAVQDRARTLFRSGVAISDPHAPMEYSVVSKRLIGRVLLNSEDERTGALQTMFETTEGNIEIIRHDGTLRAAWSRGDLAPGNVVTIDSLRSSPDKLYAASVGRDPDVLADDKALGSIARRMRTMGLAVGDSDKGWIGQFNAALRARNRRGCEEADIDFALPVVEMYSSTEGIRP